MKETNYLCCREGKYLAINAYSIPIYVVYAGYFTQNSATLIPTAITAP